MDSQLRNLHGAVESLVINRKELAHASGSFAKSAAVLSNCEEHTGLSRALSQLADVFEKVKYHFMYTFFFFFFIASNPFVVKTFTVG